MRRTALFLCVLLRLAVLLRRSRSSTPLPHIGMSVTENSVDLKFPADWLAEHPLTLEDLEGESRHLLAMDIKLSYV
jgi:exopolyphosphatase/guanosine-5'-triphosphate,3'-diphosphate pyrophosphatase